MSIKLMSRVWELDLSQNECLILLAMADHADDFGRCYPSVARVAWKTGYSKRAVQRILAELRERGVLEIVQRASGKPGVPTIYRLNLESLTQKAPFKRGDETAPVGVPDSTQTGDKTSARGDTATSPESSLRTINESKGANAGKNSHCPDCDSLLIVAGEVLFCESCDTAHKVPA